MVDALIHPDYRGLGVLRALLNEIVDVAKHGGLTKLEAEFNGERENTSFPSRSAVCGVGAAGRLPAGHGGTAAMIMC